MIRSYWAATGAVVWHVRQYRHGASVWCESHYLVGNWRARAAGMCSSSSPYTLAVEILLFDLCACVNNTSALLFVRMLCFHFDAVVPVAICISLISLS